MSAVGLAIGSVAFILCLGIAVTLKNVVPASVGDITLFQIGILFLGIVAFAVGGVEK